MFALQVDYLTGRAVATTASNRRRAEWPPHPDRLFSALVAACYEGAPDPRHEAALRWLEAQRPPAVVASGASRRDVVKVYVPVNDPRSLDQDLPSARSRQERYFPSVTPVEPTVWFVWREAAPGDIDRYGEALRRLAGAVTCVGHSSSLCHVGVVGDLPPAVRAALRGDASGTLRALVPRRDGTRPLRVPSAGRLDRLVDARRRDRRPPGGLWAAYDDAEPALPEIRRTALGEFFAFRRAAGPRLPLPATQKLGLTVRDTLMSRVDDPVPEVLSGHRPDGRPSDRPHVAIVPLANVGHRHADGDLLGFAVVLPRSTEADDRARILRGLHGDGGSLTLKMGRAGVWQAARVVGQPPLRSLEMQPYVGPARAWASVTPVVLDRYPKQRPGKDAAAVIARACLDVGLPRPIVVRVDEVSSHLGVPPSRAFPAWRNERRPLLHVALEFDEPVRGPVILGKGRYLGMGLLRALPSPKGQS